MNDKHDKHISSQFDAELGSISTRVLEMGGMVQAQVGQAITVTVNDPPSGTIDAPAGITVAAAGDERIDQVLPLAFKPGNRAAEQNTRRR